MNVNPLAQPPVLWTEANIADSAASYLNQGWKDILSITSLLSTETEGFTSINRFNGKHIRELTQKQKDAIQKLNDKASEILRNLNPTSEKHAVFNRIVQKSILQLNILKIVGRNISSLEGRDAASKLDAAFIVAKAAISGFVILQILQREERSITEIFTACVVGTSFAVVPFLTYMGILNPTKRKLEDCKVNVDLSNQMCLRFLNREKC